MISDGSLYSLAVFLGAASMLLIVLYHFLEINSDEHEQKISPVTGAPKTGPLKDNVGPGQINARG
ncbi:Ost4 domain containing [Lecanosticta acicola]|uniref:Dolichyl-diphosphooligosaccharide--protein glycosyltransferase subunit 4 n=1 Tax=Lecanosticta acicola TaxID=111012 RepID=A0AAI8YVM5_9PEZI|nr:Ost4 domain containing [Lecanosticta acicola]